MSQLRFELYKQRLLDTFEVEEMLDVLDISGEELLERFSEKVMEYAEQEGWDEEPLD